MGSTESRYRRQAHCTEKFDQGALKNAVVLIVGMGGLGTVVSTSLASAGVGTLILCDHDIVSISNLNRQFLYSKQDLGRKKVEVAIESLTKVNPEPHLIGIGEPFDEEQLNGLVKPHLILDCLDNLHDRIGLIGYSSKHKIPLIHAAVDAFAGQLSFFLPPKSACPLCGVSGELEAHQSNIPAIGSFVSVIGGLQASEAIKFIVNAGTLCINQLLIYDGLNNSMEKLSLQRDPYCCACST